MKDITIVTLGSVGTICVTLWAMFDGPTATTAAAAWFTAVAVVLATIVKNRKGS